MSLQSTMKTDLGVFFNSDDFAVPIVYSAAVVNGSGGSPAGISPRTINMMMEDEIDPEFETATADLDYDVAIFHIRSDNDQTGVYTVTEQGRGSAGDSFTLNGTTWYVKKKKIRPNDAATFEHILVCSTSQAPLPDYFG
jgi:hypothetical protein